MSSAEYSEELPNKSALLPVAGPVLVLATLTLSAGDPLMCLIGTLGFVASFLWKIRGFSYSLFFLGIASLCEHLFLTSNHLFSLGIEGSYVIAFFVTALSAEEKGQTLHSLHAQLEAGHRSLQNLEEELGKSKEELTTFQLLSQEKINVLQKELEELRSDHSSILVLNEVLRKTGASQKEALGIEQREKEALLEKLAFFQNEMHDLHQENDRIMNEEMIVRENRELSEKINAARIELEQALLVNETLAKAHAKESVKAKDATQCATALQLENQDLTRVLQESRAELTVVGSHLEQINEQRDRYQAIEKSLETMQAERNALKERLETAQLEIIEKEERGARKEEVVDLEKKVASLIHLEALYKQLKIQFIEKQEVLHQTRSELFLADTQLQALKIEAEQKIPDFMLAAGEVCREIEALEEHVTELERENGEFQTLVSHLCGSEPTELMESIGRKKKVKTNPEQSLLF